MPVAIPPSPSPYASTTWKYYELAARHPTLYDVKGDVVLVARQSDGMKLLFRVQSSTFGRWEAFLKVCEDRCNLCYRTSEGDEDGPCVEMDDSAEDVAAFLYAHTSNLPDIIKAWGLCIQDPMLPLKIGSILRISFKYKLDSRIVPLRNFFVSAWPQNLKAWDASERRFDSLAACITDNGAVLKRYAEDDFPEAASAIRLARDVDIPEVLPSAFYHLSRIPVSHNWEARRKPSSPRSSRQFMPASRSAKWDILTANDLLRLLHGRDKIQEFMSDNWAHSVFVACHASCSEPSRECLKSYHALTSVHSMLSEEDEAFHDPLRLLDRRFSYSIQAIQERFSICKTCAESAWRISMAKRTELWDLLPEFFEVSG